MLQAFPAHSMPKALERRDRFCDEQRHGRGCGTEQERYGADALGLVYDAPSYVRVSKSAFVR